MNTFKEDELPPTVRDTPAVYQWVDRGSVRVCVTCGRVYEGTITFSAQHRKDCVGVKKGGGSEPPTKSG